MPTTLNGIGNLPHSLLEIEAFAREIHKDDTRWGGEPYIIHPEWIASKFTGYYRKAVSWLHDTLEDHPDKVTEELLSEKFGPLVASYVGILTHQDGESYEDYITRIGESRSSVAISVKQMDLTHNMLDLKHGKRRTKYQTAFNRLEAFAKTADIS